MLSKYYVGPKFNNKYKMSGWFNDSYRHSLAALGVKTGRKESLRKFMAVQKKFEPKRSKDEPFVIRREVPLVMAADDYIPPIDPMDPTVHEALGLSTDPEKIARIRKKEERMQPVKIMPKPEIKEFRGLGFEVRRPFAYLTETGHRVVEGTPTFKEVFTHPEATKEKILSWQERARKKTEERVGEQEMQRLASEVRKREHKEISDLMATKRATRIEELKAERKKESERLARIKEEVKLW